MNVRAIIKTKQQDNERLFSQCKKQFEYYKMPGERTFAQLFRKPAIFLYDLYAKEFLQVEWPQLM